MRRRERNLPPLWVYYIERRYKQNGDDTRFMVAAPNRIEAFRCFFGEGIRERAIRWSKWGSDGIVSFGIDGRSEAWAKALSRPGVVFQWSQDRRRVRTAKQQLTEPRPWALWHIPDDEAERLNLTRMIGYPTASPMQPVSAKNDRYAKAE